MEQPLVRIANLSKSFGGVQALIEVGLDVAPGEVHALCGENGAGKSTLNKVLSGSVVPDSGSVTFAGKPLRTGSVAASEAAGIAILHQESAAFPHLNAEDNLFVGREPMRLGGLLLDRASMRRQTREQLDRLGETLNARKPLGELTFAQRQMVSLARALSRSCRLLIMDEPTASLSAREMAVLFDLIRQLRSDGVSILYVSHRLEEVFELADRVTVLRDGRKVETRPVSELDRGELVRLMVGRDVRQPGQTRATAPIRPPASPLLRVQNLTRHGAFHDISFSVHAGEIVGMAGLVGAGRSEVARALFGIDRPDGGGAELAGSPLPLGSPPEAIRRGLALVPEDRQHQGLALPMTIGENLSLAVLRSVTRRGFFSRKLEMVLAERLIGELSIHTPGPALPAESLSGGNQQKVLLGKWLAASPRVLILDEPTRGIDVGAKAEVHRLMRELAGKGVGILLISSELPEILSMSDRILVMREGALAGELNRGEATQERVLGLALPDAGPTAAVGDATSRPDDSEQRSRPRGRLLLRRLAQQREYGVLALLALTVAVVAAVNPAFLKLDNLRDMLVHVAPAAIVACGLTLVIVTREIDISVGSLMGLLAAVVGILTSPQRVGASVAVGVLVTLLAGTGVGFVTGLLVTLGRVPSIIVTLGMLTALRGATEMTMRGEWITELPAGLRFWGIGTLGGVPVCLWVAAAVIALTSAITRVTPLGRRLYAVGSSPRSAFLAGLSERKLKLFAFTFTGLLTALATLVSAPQLSVIESGTGVGFELLVVTCVVVGGTSINGGKGTVFGSTLGVLLLGIVATVLIFLKLGEMSTYWERAIQGAFILVAVLADHLARRRSAVEVGA